MNAQEIIDGIKSRRMRYLAKGITLVENGDPESETVISTLFPYTGKAHYIGITGNPGAGKSTLVNVLARYYLQQGKKVAVLAVDPSSPISGGAVLGDRIRMDTDLLGENFYFRSISNRSHLGGISLSTFESVLLLDAYGFDIIMVETVGTGQNETSIMNISHTNVVVTVPGLGDDVQAEKAGLLEIADIFVVNKSDLPGAKELKSQLKLMISLRPFTEWKPKVVVTNALLSEGIDSLVNKIEEHRSISIQSNKERTEKLLEEKFEEKIKQEIIQKFRRYYETQPSKVDDFLNRKISHVDLMKQFSDEFFANLYQIK